jgi:soluble lytic murein transglycosylase-like protein
MKLGLRIYLPAVALGLLCTANSAQAEIVVLTSGRTLSIKGHRMDGASMVLQMRTGGEVTCDKSLIEKIVDDEVPYPDPETREAIPAVASEPGTDSAPDPVPAGPYAEIIAAMAETHGVDAMLISALIQVESGNKATARSNKGAMGLMQLMPSTARLYKLRNPYDPKANIAAGVKHLKSLLDRFRTVDLALAAYNAGEGAVKKFNGIPPYRETRNYVSRILSLAGIQ